MQARVQAIAFWRAMEGRIGSNFNADFLSPVTPRNGRLMPCSLTPSATCRGHDPRGCDAVPTALITSSHRHPCANGHQFSMAMPQAVPSAHAGFHTFPALGRCVSASLFPEDSP